jgi:inorganic pyrophosphatase
MNLWHDISLGEKAPEEIYTIIEVPKGSANKYEISKETGMISLDRVLHTAQGYPADYGFAPQTLWDDGDALDVVVLTTHPLHPGIGLNVRPVAMIDMIDNGESDVKILGVPADDPRWSDVNDLGDLNPHTLKEINHFFMTYKQLQNKTVEIKGVEGRNAAVNAVKRSIELYNEKFGKK